MGLFSSNTLLITSKSSHYFLSIQFSQRLILSSPHNAVFIWPAHVGPSVYICLPSQRYQLCVSILRIYCSSYCVVCMLRVSCSFCFLVAIYSVVLHFTSFGIRRRVFRKALELLGWNIGPSSAGVWFEKWDCSCLISCPRETHRERNVREYKRGTKIISTELLITLWDTWCSCLEQDMLDSRCITVCVCERETQRNETKKQQQGFTSHSKEKKIWTTAASFSV